MDTESSTRGGHPFVRAMRPRQWTKNLFVFAAVIFAGEMDHPSAVWTSAAAFVCFVALSVSSYLFNDIKDRDEDRSHPVKRHRPIASGDLPVGQAAAASAALAAAGAAGAFAIGWEFGVIALGYWLMTAAYTLWLKRQVILDVFVIAAGFVLRAIGGAVAISVPISGWLIACTTLLALFLALAKRRSEMVTAPESGRQTLEEYSLDFIDQMISVVTSGAVVAYMFYAFQSDTARETRGLIWTVPFVLYGIFRYLYLVYRKDLGESPEQLVVEDRPLMASLTLWAIISAAILWSRQ